MFVVVRTSSHQSASFPLAEHHSVVASVNYTVTGCKGRNPVRFAPELMLFPSSFCANVQTTSYKMPPKKVLKVEKGQTLLSFGRKEPPPALLPATDMEVGEEITPVSTDETAASGGVAADRPTHTGDSETVASAAVAIVDASSSVSDEPSSTQTVEEAPKKGQPDRNFSSTCMVASISLAKVRW